MLYVFCWFGVSNDPDQGRNKGQSRRQFSKSWRSNEFVFGVVVGCSVLLWVGRAWCLVVVVYVKTRRTATRVLE